MRIGRPSRMLRCTVIGCLALGTLPGCSQSEVCAVTTSDGTATVGARFTGQRTMELVKQTDEGSTTMATSMGPRRTQWFAVDVSDDEALYGWIGVGDAAKGPHPSWLSADNGDRIEPTVCRIGQDTLSIVVASDDVILVQQSGETVLEHPTGGLMGSISMFE